jgi:nicotinamidase-related amidase
MGQTGSNMKPALLVIDIQNVWLDENKDLRMSVEKRIEVINEAIAWFRRNKRPIVAIYHEDKDVASLPGTKPFEFPKTIRINETDIKITKRYPSAFGKTELEAVLRKKGCDTLVIAWLSASGCVLATYFGAMDCDFRPYLVQGGVASHSEEHVRFAEEICETLNVHAIDQLLR